MTRTIFASLARIADFETMPFDVSPLDQSQWANGDYVIAKVVGQSTALYQVEDCNGDMIPVQAGTLIVGALGVRAATLEGVGSWTDVVDGRMHAMTSAGLLGAFTSYSRYFPEPMSLDYMGHVIRNGRKSRMMDFAMQGSGDRFSVPTVLLVGTSMSAGKTVSGRLACRVLAAAGQRVIGAKLTGAGRYRDILSFRRAGAVEIYDFVDVGLPSTVVPEQEFRAALRTLLHHIEQRRPDVLIAEAGASPLEPYNGATAIDELDGHVRCTILSASDPYAVLGVIEAFALRPDLVTGPATNTSAGRALVRKLTGVAGIDIADPEAEPQFRQFLLKSLGVELTKAC
jgi:hypothetical protein